MSLASTAGAVIAAVCQPGCYRATKYVSATQTIKATRKRFEGKVTDRHLDLVVTIGRPNWRERKFLKLCAKAGESLPIRKIQLQRLPHA